MAPESSPASQGSIRRFLWNSAKVYVDARVEQVIEEPTKDVNIQVYKSAYRGVTSKDTSWVYTPESLHVELSTYQRS